MRNIFQPIKRLGRPVRWLANSIKRFGRDEEGVFWSLFAVMALVLVATSGAVVDFVTVEKARNRAQVALDAAVLALQSKIYTMDVDALKTDALALMVERINDTSISVTMETPVISETDGSLYMKTTITVPLSFVALIGITEMSASVVSKATRRRNYIEVAMVLDNSLSMNDGGGARIQALRAGAKSATSILFDGETTSTNTWIGIVPFTWFVNVGPSNHNASWIDQAGIAPISNDNFANEDGTPITGPVDRLEIYENFYGSSDGWQGCVEAREGDYGTNDAEPPDAFNWAPELSGGPTLSDTEAAKLFTPAFAPDEADSNGAYSNSYISDYGGTCAPQTVLTRTCTWTYTRHGCNQWGNNCNWNRENDYSAEYPDGTIINGPDACSDAGGPYDSDDTDIVHISGWNYDKIRTRVFDENYTLTLPVKIAQERLCKYQGGSVNPNASASFVGPNIDCPSEPILPLSNNRTTIDHVIDQMAPEGGTNIHQGAIWGFHLLSPTEPFTEGREYDTATYKVMILMTDGNNSFWDSSNINGTKYYGAYGYPTNGRSGPPSWNEDQMETLLNELTVASCESARDQNIEIYTIGLDPPNPETRQMLIDCATDPSYAHFPIANSELVAVFESIATQLADLRLAL